jgi:DNA-directed RNA polymerase subunit RPC12/RpoP
MITSDNIRKMSNEEFDIFQREENNEIRKKLKEDMSFDVPNNPTFKCSICHTIFESTTYCNITCPKCKNTINFKQRLIETLEMIEKGTAFKN